MLLFTVYIIRGENNGFAVLWLTIIPIVFMIMIDLKKGFFFSAYIVVLYEQCRQVYQSGRNSQPESGTEAL